MVGPPDQHEIARHRSLARPEPIPAQGQRRQIQVLQPRDRFARHARAVRQIDRELAVGLTEDPEAADGLGLGQRRHHDRVVLRAQRRRLIAVEQNGGGPVAGRAPPDRRDRRDPIHDAGARRRDRDGRRGGRRGHRRRRRARAGRPRSEATTRPRRSGRPRGTRYSERRGSGKDAGRSRTSLLLGKRVGDAPTDDHRRDPRTQTPQRRIPARTPPKRMRGIPGLAGHRLPAEEGLPGRGARGAGADVEWTPLPCGARFTCPRSRSLAVAVASNAAPPARAADSCPEDMRAGQEFQSIRATSPK